MTTIAAPAPTYEELMQENNVLHRENKKLRYECWQLRREKDLSHEIDAVPSSILLDGVKQVAKALTRRLADCENDYDYRRLDVDQLASEIGKEAGAVRNAIHRLGEVGALRVKPPIRDKGTRRYLPMEAAPCEPYHNPHLLLKLPPTQKKNIGGTRPGSGRPKQCIHCHSENIVLYTRVHCKDCGRDWNYEEEDQAKDDNQLDYELSEEDGQEDEPKDDNQLDYELSEEGRENEDGHQVDNVIDQAKDDNQLDYELSRAVSPSTPPCPDTSAILSLMRDVAGNDLQHIVMNPRSTSQANKYRTENGPLSDEQLLAHLAGTATYGSKQRHGISERSSMTRVFRVDLDNADALALAYTCAQAMKADGLIPTIEESPAHGGDHPISGYLTIVLDRLMDTAHGLALLKARYPRLAGMEWVPTGNLRYGLPVRRYKCSGTDAWCLLYDEQHQQLSTDGITGWTALLNRQTPVNVLKSLTPKPVLTCEQGEIRTGHDGGVLGRKEQASKSLPSDDRSRQVIADFNATHTWEDILGAPDRHGKYLASWRNDRTPNVAINPRTDLAKDFSSAAWMDKSMDKYDCWCLIQGKASWEAFKKQDLDQRCNDYRQRRVVV